MKSISMMGRVFQILDCQGRCWGSFEVKREAHFLGEYDIQGMLNPSDDFELVRPLFAQYESRFMEGEGNVEEVSVKEILELNPCLVDMGTGEKVNVGNALFITEDMLVTCGVVTSN